MVKALKAPKIREDTLEISEGWTGNIDVKCSVCGRTIPPPEDCYEAEGVRGAAHYIHKDCAVRVGLKW